MQEIKSCPVKYFPYLESKMPCSVAYSAWKYSCFKLNCHKRKKYSNFKNYRYQDKDSNKLLPKPLPFTFTIPIKSLMVHNTSKIFLFSVPFPTYSQKYTISQIWTVLAMKERQKSLAFPFDML